MSKTANRAAAKAYHQEQLRKDAEEAKAKRVKADLDAAGELRHYLIFKAMRTAGAEKLLEAIDDYAEQLTGDRRALHTRNHSIDAGAPK